MFLSLLFLNLWLTELAHHIGPTFLSPNDEMEMRCLHQTLNGPHCAGYNSPTVSSGRVKQFTGNVNASIINHTVYWRSAVTQEERAVAVAGVTSLFVKENKHRQMQAAVISRSPRDSPPRPRIYRDYRTRWTHNRESGTWCCWLSGRGQGDVTLGLVQNSCASWCPWNRSLPGPDWRRRCLLWLQLQFWKHVFYPVCVCMSQVCILEGCGGGSWTR